MTFNPIITEWSLSLYQNQHNCIDREKVFNNPNFYLEINNNCTEIKYRQLESNFRYEIL